MKIKPWIFPVLAALVIGGWIFSQKKSAASLEQKIRQVTHRIQLVKTRSEERQNSAKWEKEKNSKKPDWKSYGAAFGTVFQPDLRTTLHLEEILSGMSLGDLRAELEKIRSSGFNERDRNTLETKVLSAMLEKDPKAVLEFLNTKEFYRLEQGINELGFVFSQALEKWGKNDPSAATAWLDAQIAEGKLDNKSLEGVNLARLHLECAWRGACRNLPSPVA